MLYSSSDPAFLHPIRPAPTARVLYRATGRGLRTDADFVSFLLQQAGYQVDLVALPPRTARQVRWSGKFERLLLRRPNALTQSVLRWFLGLYHGFGSLGRAASAPARVDLTLHLEAPFYLWHSRSRVNWLVPNQEWFAPAWRIYLPLFDRIICKTQTAQRIFLQWHPRVQFCGFSAGYVAAASSTTSSTTSSSTPPYFLHIAGNSQMKGTQSLIKTWAANPHWPKLMLVVDDAGRYAPLPQGVERVSQPDQQQLAALRLNALAVLAPSQVEGFGHVLLEAMAEGALLLTTDAAPMNELVGPDRGLLVAAHPVGALRAGTAYRVDDAALVAAIERILHMPTGERDQLKARARAWAQTNHQQVCEAWILALRVPQ